MRPITFGDWTNLGALLLSVLALIVAVMSYRASAKATALSEQQEARREPRLILHLLDFYFVRVPDVAGARVYAFQMRLANPTDSDNAIADIELQVRYSQQTQMSMRLRAVDGAPAGETAALVVPSRVAAHDTISGWCYFFAPAELMAGMTVEGYELAITDSHGQIVGEQAWIMKEKPR